MQSELAPVVSEDARLESLGYKPQLNRVLGLFANFAVAASSVYTAHAFIYFRF